VSVTLHPSQDSAQAAAYLKEWPYNGDATDNQELSDNVLKSIVGPRPLGADWTKVAEAAGGANKEDVPPTIVPISDIFGPKTITFIADDARVIVHGNLTEVELQTVSEEQS
jgi:hypothetical protein